MPLKKEGYKTTLGELFASVALMSGAFSMVNTLGYKNAYKRAELALERANANSRNIFGDKWNDLRARIRHLQEM